MTTAFDVVALESDAARALAGVNGVAARVGDSVCVQCTDASRDDGTRASISLHWTDDDGALLFVRLTGSLPIADARLHARAPVGMQALVPWRTRFGAKELDVRFAVTANDLGLRDGRAIREALVPVANDVSELEIAIVSVTVTMIARPRADVLAALPRLAEVWRRLAQFRFENPPPAPDPIVPTFDVAALADALGGALGSRGDVLATDVCATSRALDGSARELRVRLAWNDARGASLDILAIGPIAQAGSHFSAMVRVRAPSSLFVRLFAPPPARRDHESALAALRVLSDDPQGVAEAQHVGARIGAVLPWLSSVEWIDEQFIADARGVPRDDVIEASQKLAALWHALMAVRR